MGAQLNLERLIFSSGSRRRHRERWAAKRLFCASPSLRTDNSTRLHRVTIGQLTVLHCNSLSGKSPMGPITDAVFNHFFPPVVFFALFFPLDSFIPNSTLLSSLLYSSRLVTGDSAICYVLSRSVNWDDSCLEIQHP
ncbi:hypothetical protein R1flu_028002 [Riccia fluitans]|uniref:Uncharacterized protein n=1 Tax=Riccia fluitans TaxID=41844 RepID=A0ABD1XKE7_9MARC